jgi:hypothetical protein
MGREESMYVVWKRRRIATGHEGRVGRIGRGVDVDRPATHCPHEQQTGRELLVPYVVRARRAGGKPRQETVLILPGIRSCCLGEPVVLAHWWLYVDGRLDWVAKPPFGSMTPQEAAAVRARLEETVPRAPFEVVARVKAEQEARETE